ncbi:hypothetical protein M6B38_343485 [Iris pallida]|uniref:Uncharacterized protein n=1 Tax=Iris pallida TaxID=29817 RepID=A0AAX6GTQ3_IRIPA|nr:hypothetical protein M6B38_343485 [Iris pallida]
MMKVLTHGTDLSSLSINCFIFLLDLICVFRFLLFTNIEKFYTMCDPDELHAPF